MRKCRPPVALWVVALLGCQTITSDQVIFEPQKLDLPLDQLVGRWSDSDGETFVVRREAADRFVIEPDEQDTEPLPITLLPEGGLRVDRPPVDGEPQTPVFVDLHKVDGGYLVVAADAATELRGRDLSWLMYMRVNFTDQRAEIDLSMLSGNALYELLEKQPNLLAHEKHRGQREGELGAHVTIRLKDDPAKIRRFLIDRLKDEELFVSSEDGPTAFTKRGDLPTSRPTTQGT